MSIAAVVGGESHLTIYKPDIEGVNMGPKRHEHCKLFVFVSASLVFMFGIPSASDHGVIFWLVFWQVIIFACLFIIFSKAKCERCGSDLDEDCRKSRMYRCAKCGWTYDTGSSCEG